MLRKISTFATDMYAKVKIINHKPTEKFVNLPCGIEKK